MSKRIIESIKDCKLVKEKAIENGHDCWGKLEWTEELYVYIGDKREIVHEGMFIVHDGKNVEAAIYDWQLDKYKEVERSEEVKKEDQSVNWREVQCIVGKFFSNEALEKLKSEFIIIRRKDKNGRN